MKFKRFLQNTFGLSFLMCGGVVGALHAQEVSDGQAPTSVSSSAAQIPSDTTLFNQEIPADYPLEGSDPGDSV